MIRSKSSDAFNLIVFYWNYFSLKQSAKLVLSRAIVIFSKALAAQSNLSKHARWIWSVKRETLTKSGIFIYRFRSGGVPSDRYLLVHVYWKFGTHGPLSKCMSASDSSSPPSEVPPTDIEEEIATPSEVQFTTVIVFFSIYFAKKLRTFNPSNMTTPAAQNLIWASVFAISFLAFHFSNIILNWRLTLSRLDAEGSESILALLWACDVRFIFEIITDERKHVP